MIGRDRSVTIALGYHGGSVISWLMDITAMRLGFRLVRVLPVRAGIGIFLADEAATIWRIRDGLLPGVLMLLWPLEAVRVWQGGA